MTKKNEGNKEKTGDTIEKKAVMGIRTLDRCLCKISNCTLIDAQVHTCPIRRDVMTKVAYPKNIIWVSKNAKKYL